MGVYNYTSDPSNIPRMPTTTIPGFMHGPDVNMNLWLWETETGNTVPYQPANKQRQHAIITAFDFRYDEPDTADMASTPDKFWTFDNMNNKVSDPSP